MKKTSLVAFFIILFTSSCSIQKLAVRSMSGLLDNSMAALYEESDLQLAEQAIASDLKLLEGIIKSDPGNGHFLFLACQGFGAYALGFVEDADPGRASHLYLRGRDYGLRVLKKNRTFKKALSGNIDDFETALNKLSMKHVPVLFWTANNWANWINLNFDNPAALADLPRVQLMMNRVLALDESYFYGGAHLFFASIYAVRPPIFGGSMKKAKYHFDRCFEFSKEKFLLPYVYYAQYYATRQLDEALFKNTLTKVLAAPHDILPGQQLPNAIAKKKAKILLKKMDQFF